MKKSWHEIWTRGRYWFRALGTDQHLAHKKKQNDKSILWLLFALFFWFLIPVFVLHLDLCFLIHVATPFWWTQLLLETLLSPIHSPNRIPVSTCPNPEAKMCQKWYESSINIWNCQIMIPTGKFTFELSNWNIWYNCLLCNSVH